MSNIESAAETEQAPVRRAMSYPAFRAFVCQRLFTTLGTSIQSVIVGWHIYAITGRTLDLGLVGLAQFLPNAGLALFAGQLADRVDRRIVMRGSLLAQMACSLALILLTLRGGNDVLPIYAVLVVFGAARAFMSPASQSIIPRLVDKEALGGAIALGSSLFMTAQIFGPAVGGLVYVYGASAAFAASCACFVVAFIATFFLRQSLKAQSSGAAGTKGLLAGVRFIRSKPAILGAISLDLFAVLLGGATALLPVYARDILDVGPRGLGALRGAPAAGALLMSLYLARRSLGRHSGHAMFLAVLLFGIATIVFGFSHNFFLSLLSLAVLGASDMVSVYMRSNLVQRSTPDEMRGRVASVNFVFIGASNELGEMESGFTASLFGSGPQGAIAAVVTGGVGTVLIVALWAWRFPSLRRVGRLEEIEAG